MPLSNSQYDTIQRQYDARQLQNQHAVQSRKAQLYRKYPRLKELDDLTAASSVRHARKLLEGDSMALPHLKQELDYYRAEREAILASAGVDADYFEPPYACPACKDTGYINGGRCHCFKQAAIDLVYTQSNMKNILEKENFSTFTYNYYSDSEEKAEGGVTPRANACRAVKCILAFLENFDKRFENLLLYGGVGTGKTFLSNCIAKDLLDSGHSVIYFTAFQLFEVLEKNKFEKGSDSAMPIQNLLDCDLLIIDDLGTELINTFTTSQLFLCMNERNIRRKSTLISTNWELDMLHNIYTERVFSRLISGYTAIKLFGDDIRLQNKHKYQ